MKDQSILENIKIASACHARWEDMSGNDRARFCSQCNKNVYNFSAMTRAEVESLIREKEGRLCGRFYRRRDGRILTNDCEVGVKLKRNRLVQMCGAIAGFMIFLLGGCARRSPEVMGKIAPATMGDVCVPAATNSPPALLGEIAVPRAPSAQ